MNVGVRIQAGTQGPPEGTARAFTFYNGVEQAVDPAVYIPANGDQLEVLREEGKLIVIVAPVGMDPVTLYEQSYIGEPDYDILYLPSRSKTPTLCLTSAASFQTATQ